MKRIEALLLSLIPLLGLPSCSKKEWRIASSDFIRTHGEFVYEVTFTDYDLDYSLQSRTDVITDLGTFKGAPGGCSAARSNGFVGRNLDLPYGHFAEVIVKVPRNEKRFASVGSFCALHTFTKDRIKPSELNDTLYHLMPISICDGINENGVVCEMNVVPVKDITPTTGTDHTKEDLNLANITRFVLDNATSAAHAIHLLRNKNICNPWDWSGSVKKGWEYHYMIADENETYVVEFVNNRLVVLEEDVSANYYLSILEGTPHGMGLERYQKLKTGVSKDGGITSVEDMAKLMQEVYWTKSNYTQREGFTEDEICYSDHFGAKDGDIEITKFNYLQYKDKLIEVAQYEKTETDTMLNEDTGENPLGLWFTLHTCVFDIVNTTMNFYVHQPEDVSSPIMYDVKDL